VKIFAAGLIFCLSLTHSPAQEAVLHGIIKDEASQALGACTVQITDSQGRLVTESESFRAGFRCLGEFTRNLPAGRTIVRVTRGFETQFTEKELGLAPGERQEVSFVLKRNVDLRRRGWYAGDSHAHMLHGERTVPVSFDFVALTARAEDLQYLSLAQAWNLSDPTPERLEAELRPRSTRDCVLTWNLEAPKNYYRGDAGRCLGHCWNVGLRGRTREGADVIQTLIDASAWDYESEKPTYANFESHHLIHEQGGAVFYTHPARWWTGAWGGQGGYPKVDQMRVSNMAVELPLDTVLGPTYDGLDVITGPGEVEANDKAFRLWALLLNHGYRLAPTGSSDACFDRPGGAAPGVPRTYTYVQGRFNLEKVAKATAAGHTFVTTGPLLLADMDSQPPGTALRNGDKAHALRIESWASGDNSGGLERIEILRNGEIWKSIPLPDRPRYVRTEVSVRENEGAWYCARAVASGTRRQLAVTGAFYFDDGAYHPPAPARTRVQATVVDAETGAPLKGRLKEVVYAGTIARELKGEHVVRDGKAAVSALGTVRLRAEARGYRPMVLSPVLDNPGLMDFVTHLNDADLLEWTTFEQARKALSEVELVFKMQKAGSQ
jgi:hypothetical protein